MFYVLWSVDRISIYIIKDMNRKGVIFINNAKNSLNVKVRDGIEIHVLKKAENIESRFNRIPIFIASKLIIFILVTMSTKFKYLILI